MSFQFFSKLDNKLTDGPASKLDPDRPFRAVAQGGGEMGKAIQRTLQDDKANKRMARRAYRSAMRSNDPRELAIAVDLINNAGGRFMGIGAQERAAEQEMQSRGINVEAAPNRMGQTSTGSVLENKGSTFGRGADQRGFTPQAEDPATYNPFLDPTVPTRNVPFAQRQREDFRSDLKKSGLLNDPSVSKADRELARAQAYKRADSLGIDRSKVDKEMGWDLEDESLRIESNRSTAEAGLIESETKETNRRKRLGLDDYSERDEILNGLAKAKDDARIDMDQRRRVDFMKQEQRALERQKSMEIEYQGRESGKALKARLEKKIQKDQEERFKQRMKKNKNGFTVFE